MKPTILFFTTALEHTTFRKTARMLKNEGAEIKMVGFTRQNFPVSNDNISTQTFGTVHHGNYLKRLFILFSSAIKLRKMSRNYDVLYVFTLDTLLIAFLSTIFKKRVIVYQIQDIRPVFFGDSLKAKIFRFLEGWLLKKVDHLVVSSIDYYSKYILKHYDYSESKLSVIENKLEYDLAKNHETTNTDLITENSVTIGYFGVLRCKKSWEILRSITEANNGKKRLYVRGKPVVINDINEQANNCDYITYDGVYKSPDDLADIYGNVDIVWAAYPYSHEKEGNWQMARTIRFYEACAFYKPVVVQLGTPQAAEVRKHNIGMVLDMGDEESAIEKLNSISPEKINSWKNNLRKLDRSMFIHSNEYQKLLGQLKNLVRSKL